MASSVTPGPEATGCTLSGTAPSNEAEPAATLQEGVPFQLGFKFPNGSRNPTNVEAFTREQESPVLTEQVGYLTLPRELRDEIMVGALMQGGVDLPFIDIGVPEVCKHRGELYQLASMTKGSSFKKSLTFAKLGLLRLASPLKRCQIGLLSPKAQKLIPEDPGKAISGFGLLMTSNFILEEAAPIYYGRNTFFLPRGRYLHAVMALNNIRPEHRSHIKSIGIKITLRDLTNGIVQCIEHMMCHHSSGYPVNFISPAAWASICTHFLLRIWNEKIDFLVNCEGLAPTLRDPLITSLQLNGRNIGRFHDVCRGTYRPALTRRLQTTSGKCARKIQFVVQEIGWKGFRKWLNGETHYPNKPWNDRNDWALTEEEKSTSGCRCEMGQRQTG